MGGVAGPAVRRRPRPLRRRHGARRRRLPAPAAPLPAPIIGLLSDCVATSTLRDFSLAHLVGYKRSQIPLVRAQRYALMGSLAWLADKPAQPAEEDSPGALNAGKALKFYLNRGKDPCSIIARFAF